MSIGFHHAGLTSRPFRGEVLKPFVNRSECTKITPGAKQILDELRQQWEKEPNSVHPAWAALFAGNNQAVELEDLTQGFSDSIMKDLMPDAKPEVRATAQVLAMVRFFQKLGHYFAETNPLENLPQKPPFIPRGRYEAKRVLGSHDLSQFGFTDADRKTTLQLALPNTGGLIGSVKLREHERHPEWEGRFVASVPVDNETNTFTIGQLYDRFKDIYCGSIALEYLHIQDRRKLNWLRNQLELPKPYTFSKEMKTTILNATADAVLFENFLAQKFPAVKRFGLDGLESMTVGMKHATEVATLFGVTSCVIGLAHRGRLNVLTNVVHKPAMQVFSEFLGKTGFGGCPWGNIGDLKYHMGNEFQHIDPKTNRAISYTVVPNPSHLGAVHPVVLGVVRARQAPYEDISRVLPIMVHGDAALAGQGVGYETLQMSNLNGYSVGGTIHIVCNNQIGFTTYPADAGSGHYPSDIAKALNCPIFHVNANDPEAVARVMEVAVEWRQKFKSDIFIDLVGYRKSGHSEVDTPRFSNPTIYNHVERAPDVLKKYREKLLKEKSFTSEEIDGICQAVMKRYENAFAAAKTYKPEPLTPFSNHWVKLLTPDKPLGSTANVLEKPTGVPLTKLKPIGIDISSIPKSIEAHPTIQRIYSQRLKAIEKDGAADYGFAEALAFGTLVSEGFWVRLTGQDSVRGTFAHRHAGIHDQKSSNVDCFIPLEELANRRNYHGGFEIHNSPLSEYAVLGFEYGYSLENPNNLNLWEAQFGDFSNGAQVIIDQFIAAGEVKWGNSSGLVMILPHGYDGQGPEHSSSRIERYLQLCDDREDFIRGTNAPQYNLQLVVPTTAANYFHVIRRQVQRNFRKPLMIFLPKKIMKMREASSLLSEFGEGTTFQRFIPDPHFDPSSKHGDDHSEIYNREDVRKLILCSGQIYYDLVKARKSCEHGKNIMIARVEELSPCPINEIVAEIKSLPNVRTVAWCQEEPMNMGAWTYISARLNGVINHLQAKCGRLVYCGRDSSASPATGDALKHNQELKRIMNDALDLDKKSNSFLEDHLKSQTEAKF